MVILPFMKYGDLHSFLLRSRLEMAPQVMTAASRAPCVSLSWGQTCVCFSRTLEDLVVVRLPALVGSSSTKPHGNLASP